MKKIPALAMILAALPGHLSAHPGHHHETGLPDFAAHILLGLQYLGAILVPAAAIAFFIRFARRKKNPPHQEK